MDQQRQEVEQQPENADGARAILRPGVENQINDSAQRLMTAMRELLNSMTYRYWFVFVLLYFILPDIKLRRCYYLSHMVLNE